METPAVTEPVKESEGLLPCSQEPATSFFREPDENSPHAPILLVTL
jgi:hypothetical protein